MNNDEWIFFKDVDFSDKKILQYHVDTRDFHCLTRTEKSDKVPDINILSKYPERFFYSAEEVKNLLDRFYTESGGEKDWRFFFLKSVKDWSMKYIRIYRIEQGLIVCTKDNHALKKETTNAEVGKKDY